MYTQGLTGFQVKLFALIFMTLDHIHYIFSGACNVPVLFNILGRIAAPLFIFMVTEGMRYTRSREKYLLRLWIGSIFMAVANPVFNNIFPMAGGGVMIANIFSTLFIICLFIYGAEKVGHYRAKKETGKAVAYIFVTLLPVIFSILFFLLVAAFNGNDGMLWLLRGFLMFFPNLIATEGGFLLVLLGIGFYIFGNNKKKTSIFLLLISLVVLLTNGSPFTLDSLFTVKIEWLMLLALPFILLYNGEKGRGMKYLFYFYYPSHIYALMIISNFITK